MSDLVWRGPDAPEGYELTVKIGDSGKKTKQVDASSDTPDEFTRFEVLAGKILKVPKSEIDAERKKS